MSARVCKCDGCEEDRLPMFHRTIKVPAGLWKDVKARSAEERKAIRRGCASGIARSLTA